MGRGQVRSVLIGIVGVGAVIVCLLREEEFVVLVGQNTDMAGTVNIGIALGISDDGVRVDQINDLDNIQQIIITLQSFACSLTATGVTQQADSVRIHIRKGHAITNCIIQTTAHGQPFSIGQGLGFAHAVHVNTNGNIAAAGKFNAVVLHFFLVVVTTMLNKYRRSGIVSSCRGRNVDIQRLIIAGLGHVADIFDGGSTKVCLHETCAKNANHTEDCGNYQPFFGAFSHCFSSLP